MDFVSTQSQINRGRGSCPGCDNPPYTAFNWRYAREQKDAKLAALSSRLAHIQDLKFGSIYACTVCGLHWHLDEAQLVMNRIPQDRLSLIHEWNGKSLSPSEEQLHALDSIGGTGPDHYGNHAGIIAVPCAAKLQTGEVIDPAMVWVTKAPPYHDYLGRVLLLDAISSISPSEYALPLEVRVATLFAEEVRMGFAPTRVESVDGNLFVLNWTAAFLNKNGVKGRDILLSTTPFRLETSVPIVSDDTRAITYIFADWFDGAENLNKAH